MRKILVLLTIILCLLPAGRIAAADAYFSYTYSYDSNGHISDVAAPQPYKVDKVFTDTYLGISLLKPQDIVTDKEGNLYIVDSGIGAIYVFDEEMNCLKSISEFYNNGETDKFSEPSGIFVSENGDMYIADTNNKRIVVLDKDNNLVKIISSPQNELLDSTFVFQPLKLVVDNAGRIFVLVKNVNKGLLQLSQEGDFVGYIGSNKVVYSFTDLLWKTVMTTKQKNQLLSFVPVDYSNISIDENGFIYAVTSVTDTTASVRRLNPSGDDVLVRSPLNGSAKVSGDVIYTQSSKAKTSGPSSFVDITQDERGNYYVLDGKRGRIFAYDEEGNLLFVFGGMNTFQKGTFSQPSAILYKDGKLYVLDSAYSTLTSFVPTEYTQLIHEAAEAYITQDYEKSIQLWNKVISHNGNFDLAYMKAGYAYYRLQNYKAAMECFKIADAKEAYSKAYAKQKKIDMNQKLPYYIIAALVILIVIFSGLRIRRKLFNRSISNEYSKNYKYYVLYTMRHPIDSFWEMKHENKGSLGIALVIMGIYFLGLIFDHQARGFMFNSNYNSPLDLAYQFRIFVLPILIFCISNWSVTTLLDGKGTFKDIVKVIGYSMVPLIIFQLISTIMTHVLSLNELTYLRIFEYFGIGWFCLLVFIGIMQIHEYSLMKAVATIGVTAFSAAVIVFISLLFFSLLQEISGFAYSIYRETTLRLFS